MAMKEREVSLVISAKEGDSKAFEELYAHYYDKIFALARMTMRNEADCEDILQETFINAWKNLHKLSNPAGFNTWLQKITLNLCYGLLRKKNITILLDSENELDNFSEESSDELLPAIYAERNDLRVRLGKIIDSLSDVQKQTIVLYYFNEQKVEEIADVMECSVSTVKTRLFLARKAIRSEVEAQEQKSGEKFYGVAGIPLLSFGELFKQYIESQLLLAEVSGSVPVAIAEVLSQGGHGGVQAASVAAETAKGSALSALPLSAKVAATVGVLALCIGAVFLGVHFLGNSGDNEDIEMQATLAETAPTPVPIVETTPPSEPAPAPAQIPGPPTESAFEYDDFFFFPQTAEKHPEHDYIFIRDMQISTALVRLDFAGGFSLLGLDLTDEEIAPLRYMINLEELILGHNLITDLSPLSDLQNLRYLYLNVNRQITDISPLANLTNLVHLNLMYIGLDDEGIIPLRYLSGLESLDLDSNQLTDISPLSGLTNLTHLRLSANQITDITPLANLTNLRRLSATSNGIGDISSLRNITGMTELHLMSNHISDISHLADMAELRVLDLGGNQVSDLTPLSNLTNLERLFLRTNQITDVSPLSNLMNLHVLEIFGNQVVDLSPVEHVETIRY